MDAPLSRSVLQIQAAIVALAPAAMLAAFLYHPYITRLTNDSAVAAALTADTARWGLSHLAVGVASGLMVLAFLAIRSHLRTAGEQTWSIRALPFVVIGSTLFVFLPAMEIATLAAAEAGADVPTVLAELNPWFFPVLLAGALTFELGVLGFAVGIVRGGVLSPRSARLVGAALVVMATARFVPLGAALLVGGAAGVIALWPLSYNMWRSATTGPDAGPPPVRPRREGSITSDVAAGQTEVSAVRTSDEPAGRTVADELGPHRPLPHPGPAQGDRSRSRLDT